MMNLRSSLSALALVGAVFGYSSAAHATDAPLLADYEGVVLGNGASDDNNVLTTLTASPSYSAIHVDAAVVNSGSGNTDVGYTPNFAGAVEFQLGNASTVTWKDYSSANTSSVNYELVSGLPTANTQDWATFTPLSGTGTAPGTLTWSGLTPGAFYSFIITGSHSDSEGDATVTGTLSAVPLPGSLVMFGSALLGLTALGARRRSSLSA